MNPWPIISIIMGSVGLALTLFSALSRRCPGQGETIRKMLHVSMGLIALPFPWLFTSVWPVCFLCFSTLLLLSFLRFNATMRYWMGDAMLRAGRDIQGAYYFAPGICGLFWAARPHALLYCVPLLILTFADTAAALVGVRIGRRYFPHWKGPKSAEGSLTFLLTAFLCVFLPIYLWTHLPLLNALLLSGLVSLPLTGVELYASNGLDNLLLPWGGFLLLKLGGQ